MTNLDSLLKSRDIILPTKVYIVKAMVFPVVMYHGEGVEPGSGFLPGTTPGTPLRPHRLLH